MCRYRRENVNDGKQTFGGAEKSGTNWKLWGAAVAALLLLIFVLENSQEVRIKFLFIETTTPLIFGLLIAGVLGFLVGWLLPIVRGGRSDDAVTKRVSRPSSPSTSPPGTRRR